MKQTAVAAPAAPTVVADDERGACAYAVVAIGPQDRRSAASPATRTTGRATLRRDGAIGADSCYVLRDSKAIAGPLGIEGSQKEWKDRAK
jgi:hypothetical protein